VVGCEGVYGKGSHGEQLVIGELVLLCCWL